MFSQRSALPVLVLLAPVILQPHYRVGRQSGSLSYQLSEYWFKVSGSQAFQIQTGEQPLGSLGNPLVAPHYLRVKPLGRYLLGYLSYPGHPDFHRSQSHGHFPGRMVAVAVAAKPLAPGIAVATQEGVHLLFQDGR